jgi:hypothetical protein
VHEAAGWKLPMIGPRLDMLRKTAAWVREEFGGQTTDEQRAELEAEADNIEWAAKQIELLRNALSVSRGQWIHSVNANQCLEALGELSPSEPS